MSAGASRMKPQLHDNCNCGRPNRYSHMNSDTGDMVMSCNKYAVCPTYDELTERLQESTKIVSRQTHILKMFMKQFEEGHIIPKKIYALCVLLGL